MRNTFTIALLPLLAVMALFIVVDAADGGSKVKERAEKVKQTAEKAEEERKAKEEPKPEKIEPFYKFIAGWLAIPATVIGICYSIVLIKNTREETKKSQV